MNYEIARVQQYKSDVAFKTLVDGVNDNLYLIPQFQRKYRWDEGQVKELARSLFRGYPIPPVYAYRNKAGQLEILDGQQRVMSLFLYYIGKFVDTSRVSSIDIRKLNRSEMSFREALEQAYPLIPMTTQLNPEADEKEQVDISYDSLPAEWRRKLDYTNLTVIELRWENEGNRAEDLQQIFKNLNKQGTQLSPQEVRNGIYGGAFYDMLRDVNLNNQKWRSIWGREDGKEDDMEFLLRLCTLKRYVEYREGEFVIDAYQTKYHAWMDIFSEEVIDMQEDMIDSYRASLEQFFARFHNSKVIGAKKALLESIYIACEKGRLEIAITDALIGQILNSEEYKKTSRQGTVKKSSMNERWKGVYAIISAESGNSGSTAESGGTVVSGYDDRR